MVATMVEMQYIINIIIMIEFSLRETLSDIFLWKSKSQWFHDYIYIYQYIICGSTYTWRGREWICIFPLTLTVLSLPV